MEKDAAERYTDLSMNRDPILRRARQYAALTIPSLLPPEGLTQTQGLPETYQSFGARAVTSLSSRLMSAFIPTQTSMFEFRIPPEILIRAGEQDVDADTEKNLEQSAKLVNEEIDRARWRQPTFLALQHLIVTGNVMEQMLPDNTMRVYRLDQYVVVRDPMGNEREFVIREPLYRNSLPDNLREMLHSVDADKTASMTTVPLYTWGRWNPKTERWEIHQEFEGMEVPESRGTYKVSPYKALRWVAVIGEDYGRSKVEEHYGDMRSFEGLSMSVIQGSAMAARHITLIRPNAAGGINLHRKLKKAENGAQLVANPEDVSMLQFQNNAGLEVARMEKEELRRELAAAFLMNSSARRDAERVTKFELRMMIEEIESVLGGVYTSLSQELQEHRLRRLILQMKAQGKLPDWPDGLVEPVILTGMEALGREKDVERVSTALAFLQGLPPEVAAVYVKWPELFKKAMNGLQLPDTYNTEEEAQAIREQMARAQALARPQGEPQEPQGTE